jgi:hypothetical protein
MIVQNGITKKHVESTAVHGFIGVKTKLLNCVCGFEVTDLAQSSCDLLIEAACRPPLSSIRISWISHE